MSASARKKANQAEQRASSTSVLVATPHPDNHLAPAWHTFMQALQMYDSNHRHIIADICELLSGPRIASARNTLTLQFLTHPLSPEWLCMIDADMIGPPTILYDLLDHADPTTTPVLGALCFSMGRTGTVEPTLKRLVSTDPPKYQTIHDYPVDSIVRVDATGAAFLLVHRSVIQQVFEKHGDTPHPFFMEGSAAGLVELGEDVVFCARLGALDIPIHVHTGIEAPHMKYQPVDSHTYLDYRRRIHSMGGEEAARQWYLSRMGLLGNAVLQDDIDDAVVALHEAAS